MAITKEYKLKTFGPTTKRRDYSETAHDLPITDLLTIQKDSYKWFLNHGLAKTFKNIYPIESFNGRIRLEFLPKSLRLEKPKNEFDAVKLAKQKGMTYNVKVMGKVQKIDEETAEAKTQEVLFGEIPLMTSGGTFLINGSEKIIITQLLRSPGAYYGVNTKNSISNIRGALYNRLELIPKLGSWLDISHRVTGSTADYVRMSIDKKKSVSISTFLRALGMSKDGIVETFGDVPIITESILKDKDVTEEDCLEKMHRIIRKGDRITADSKKNLFPNIFFNPRRYDLSQTGRYMLNRKLNLVERITDTILAADIKIADKVLYKAGTVINFELAKEIQKQFNKKVLKPINAKGITKEVYGSYLEDNPKLASRVKVISILVNKNLADFENKVKPIIVLGNLSASDENHLLISDIVAAVSYYFNLAEGLGLDDDPDSLINKRVVAVGELLQNQFQIGLTKLERNAKERMSSKEPEKITPKNITNNKAIFNQFKTFFNSSQLSQFMDQMNPLAEIANKRRVTSLGPGGLNKDTAFINVRDVHSTHYGRICPIESPEGPSIGLILNFSNYARINELGFVETPYFKVIDNVVQSKPIFMTAFQEKGLTFAQSTININEKRVLTDKVITVRKDSDYIVVSPKEVDYVSVSSKQMTSISSSCIPFLESDDAVRALMGSNMQRQAIPLLKSEAPYVATGVEKDIAKFSASNIRAERDGEVVYADSTIIKIKHGSKNKTYKLRAFERSNQGSVISQRPIVIVGDKVKEGQIITDGPSFDKGELALGKNVTVAFTTWNGYNYEDAIIMSEKLMKDDVFTSLHIDEKTIQFRKAKIGDDELTAEVPNTSNFSRRNLDENGIVRIGSEAVAGDVLVGRVSPKGEDNPTPEEKLIAAIFAKKFSNQKDTSLKVKHGHGGTVIDVEVLSRDKGDKLKDAIEMVVKIYIAKKRKIKPGDKMAGRHGNKGVISRILPIEDMPHLADGTPVDIMLNPQGVPSRMNIGQILELHLGMAAKKLNVKFISPVFDGIKYNTITDILKEADLPENGKFDLYDPTSGEKFDHKISVGSMYMIKLAHMIDDKMHARSVGPYSLITQQPLGGKSQNGGQRFGEMETWAVESYGATNVLQELLTYKSDNIEGRNKIYNALANGAPLPKPGMPESFNVLAYELRGLGLKIELDIEENSHWEEENAI
ncbi:DNA-directed RNA polymerase subunit beta [Candidatus Mycoplasma mahonii]|uniref:DNA-directed RNA polymerase subunit beta n=1 Tax=Candidatus Mycoplasma mahonii TaxID=3004105 RepID=UPI0026F178E2|nr:DNA-directed RNA polymerase subunit beta [Candidatus Mycoplasma mahonii]WKX02355.1 DNA-directed RNA polymerase subunit beta [Candidatus Mycoplasma mahonii]